MKKIIMTLLALVLTTGAFAQGFGDFNPEDMAKMQVDRMKESYKLNDAQYNKLLKFFKDSTKKMMEDMQNGGGQGGFDMEAMQKRMKAQNDTIKSVLTEEQFKAYEEDQKKMRERFQQGGGFGGGF